MWSKGCRKKKCACVQMGVSLYLSGLFTRCLEFSLLASLSDLLVLGETVAVLSTR